MSSHLNSSEVKIMLQKQRLPSVNVQFGDSAEKLFIFWICLFIRVGRRRDLQRAPVDQPETPFPSFLSRRGTWSLAHSGDPPEIPLSLEFSSWIPPLWKYAHHSWDRVFEHSVQTPLRGKTFADA